MEPLYEYMHEPAGGGRVLGGAAVHAEGYVEPGHVVGNIAATQIWHLSR